MHSLHRRSRCCLCLALALHCLWSSTFLVGTSHLQPRSVRRPGGTGAAARGQESPSERLRPSSSSWEVQFKCIASLTLVLVLHRSARWVPSTERLRKVHLVVSGASWLSKRLLEAVGLGGIVFLIRGKPFFDKAFADVIQSQPHAGNFIERAILALIFPIVALIVVAALVTIQMQVIFIWSGLMSLILSALHLTGNRLIAQITLAIQILLQLCGGFFLLCT
eukprot:TRINITY_DN24594_c0_g1_i1.p1 TRINITY_DN24594_c0_g1~~TRINITY_DN24594_c0_g1_i1.p1  ORF type:complete len:221 (+),score=21.93 TRINITY_DN24594_c0_g1_i1:27-689(+)